MQESMAKKWDKSVVWLRDRIGLRTLEFSILLCLVCGISVALVVEIGAGILHSLEAFAAAMP